MQFKKLGWLLVAVTLLLLTAVSRILAGAPGVTMRPEIRGDVQPSDDYQSIPSIRIPDDQVPWERVRTAGVEHTVLASGESPSFLNPELPLLSKPQRAPDDLVPEDVYTIKMEKTIKVPLAIGHAEDDAPSSTAGTITLTYGFHWFQFNPYAVAVAGYARTQSDFCATKLFAQATLYRFIVSFDIADALSSLIQ